MADVLREIIAKKKERVALAKQSLPLEELKVRLQGLAPTRPFIEAISKPRTISLIAEIKKASPSRGVIREPFDHKEIAAIYQEAGVQAISVLTEEDYFQGNIQHINEVKSAVSVPLLRKDFIFEAYQIYESRVFGADAVLLIADAVTKEALVELITVASGLGLECLVEAHEEKELKKVLNLKVPLPVDAVPVKSASAKPRKNEPKHVNFAVGINNRDLRTLEVDLKTTEKLYTLISKDKVVVVESGIKSYQDVLFLKVLGVNAVLIGEAFMAAQDIRHKVEEIMGW